MAKVVTITNGTGTIDIINGTYSVTATVNGYNNTSISPATIDITAGTNNYAFTIGATGTLTLHVTEDGTASGTPVVGATFMRTDGAGTTYGNEITTDALGNAVFDNVPFADTNAPTIYYKQTASDGNHEFSTNIQSIVLNALTTTIEIANPLGAQRTIELTDNYYSGLPIESGTISLE